MSLLLPAMAAAQIRTNWFDVNPSSSNTDSQNPNGSSGGRVQHVAASSDLSRMYAATEWGGLYTSFNQGASWVRVNSFVPSAMWDVKVDPSTRGNRLRVYATSFYDGRANVPVRRSLSGISISNDGGNTWTNAPLSTLPCAVASRLNEPSAWQISIDPNNNRNVYIGTNCGLARTNDGGATWTYVDPTPGTAAVPNPAEQIYAVMAHGNNIVDVIGDNGFFRSTDGGNTWTANNTFPGTFGPGQHTLAMSPREDSVLFATTSNPFFSIFESDDGGQTWPSSITIPAGNAQGRIPFVKTNQRAASNQFDLWYGDVSLFRTGGTIPAGGNGRRVPANPTWTNVQTGAHNDVADILFNPRFGADACPLLFANDGGVYRNTIVNAPACHAAIWDQPGVTPHATWLFGFDGVPLTPNVMHGIYYGMQDNGLMGTISAVEGPAGAVPSWNNAGCCDGTTHEAQSNSIVYIQGAFGGRAFRLFRRGPNYSGDGFGEIPNYPSNGTFAAFRSGREVVRIGNDAYAIVLTDGVYTTNNIMATPIAWTSLGAPGGSGIGNVGHLKAAAVRGATSIYYHTGSGNPNGQGQIFRRAATGGGNWVPLQLPPNIVSVTVYDVDPNNGNNLIICGIDAANNFSMWRTTNYGPPWTQLNVLDNMMTGGGTFVNRTLAGGPTNFTGFGTYWQPFMVEFNPLNGNTVVAGAADAGVFLTTDLGNTWRLLSNPNTPNSTTPHIPRPLFAYFTPTRVRSNSLAFDVWIGSQGAGVTKVLVESP